MRKATGLIFLALAPLASNAQDGISVRAYAEDAGDVYVGQLVRLNVEIQTRTWFTTAPRYPEINVEGAVALLPESLGVNYSSRSGGVTLAGQRQRYVVFPQRSGVMTIPPIEVGFAVSIDGKAGPIVTRWTEPLAINVLPAPGSDGQPGIVSVTELQVAERWEQSSDELLVGDAITRTIEQSAGNTFALVLPAIEFPDVSGMTAYVKTPALDDRSERGRYSATRRDSVTYVLEEAGEFELPAIEVYWFDLDSLQTVTEVLDAVTISVAPNPHVQPAIADPQAVQDTGADYTAMLQNALDWLSRNVHWLIAIAAVGYGLRRGAAVAIPLVLAKLDAHRRQWLHSEQRYFNELLAACRANDEDELVRRFWRWSDCVSGPASPVSASVVADDAGFSGAWRYLQECRYRDNTCGSGARQRLSPALLKRLRSQYLMRLRNAPGASREAVGFDRLNPRQSTSEHRSA